MMIHDDDNDIDTRPTKRIKKIDDKRLLQDSELIEEELIRLEKRHDQVDQDTREADIRRMQMLRMRLAQLGQKKARENQKQKVIQDNSMSKEKYKFVDGRQIVLGGSGDVPLPPSLNTMKPPPLPERGKPLNDVPSPPPLGARLKPIPPPPPMPILMPPAVNLTVDDSNTNTKDQAKSSSVPANITLDKLFAQIESRK